MRKLIIFIGLFLSLTSEAQTYTFECVASGRLSGDSCDICPNTIVESRSFNGLVIYRDSAFYRWVDQPYSIRVKPGGLVEYWEHSVNPFSERITIPFDLTGFFSVEGMADSTWCNSSAPSRYQNLTLDSINATQAAFSLTGDPTDEYLQEGTAVNFTYQGDTLTINVDTTGLGGGGSGIDTVRATQPAAGFTITGSPITAPSGTFVFTLANDLAALEALSTTGIVTRTGPEAYTTRTITAGTGISVADGDGVSGNPTITNAGDLSTTNEIQAYGHASAANLYTNTLSLGGGTFSIAGAGINVVTSTAGAVTVTGTEVDGLITNEGLLGVGAGGASSSVLLSNTSTAAGVTINAAGILSISETTSANGGQITLTATEVGLGTVTSFSAGDLSPLFTTTETNPTTTPALSFTATNGTAKSVFGVTGNAAAARADIATTTADQVFRNNGANTAIGWGTVATGGITDQAVTYVKIQNAVNNNVLLGNNNGANTSYEEITPAAAQTMLGYIDGAGANQRIAYFTDANTVAAEAAFLWDAANDRQTITCALPGLGAGLAALNITNTGPDGTGEFLQIRGDISDNLLWGAINTNTSATADNILYVSQTGNAAGDPILQLNITGSGGVNTAIGLDNSDANKLKITPNGTAPGINANASLVATQASPPLWGLNKDAPSYAFDVQGVVRSTEFIGYSVDEPTVGTLGNGLGTGASIGDVTGTNNGFSITFTAGASGLVAGGNMFVVTYSDAYNGFSIPVFSQANDTAAGELNKFSFAAISGASFTMKVAAGQTLTAGATYILNFAVNGF